MRASRSLRHLLISRTRIKLLHQLFYLPSELYYVRQLVRSTREEINSVRRELANLVRADLVESETRGNRLYYWANPKSTLYSDVLSLVHKTFGLGLSLVKNKEKVGKIKLIIYSQDFLNNVTKKDSNVDLIIVGEVVLREIEPLIKKDEERRNREINYMVMNRSELQLRKQKRDPILVDFFLRAPVVIIGRPQEIANL